MKKFSKHVFNKVDGKLIMPSIKSYSTKGRMVVEILFSRLHVKPILLLFIMVVAIDCINAQQNNRFEELIQLSQESILIDSSIHYAEEALSVSTSVQEREKAFYLLAKYNIEKTEYIEAELYLNLAIGLSKQINDKLFAGYLYLEKGKCWQYRSEYVKALSFFIMGLRMLEKENDKVGLITANIYLAEYYRNVANFREANAYILKALELARYNKIDDNLRIKMYNRAAAIKSETADIDSSFYYSYLSLALSKRINNYDQEATSLNEIGFMQENLHQLIPARDNYTKAVNLWKKMNATRNWVNAMGNLARAYSKLRNFKKSNEILSEIKDIAIQNNWEINLMNMYGLYKVNYEELGDLKESYFYRIKYLELRLSTYKQENLKELEDIKSKYETEKKDYLLTKQRREIELAKENYVAKQEETIRLWIGFGLVLALCMYISYLLLVRYKLINKLTLRNREIEQKNEKLLINMEKNETLLQEVHHRVKNNLQFIYSIIELEIDTNRESAKLDSLIDMQHRIMSMSLVHQLLYNGENLSQVSVMNYIEDLVDFMDSSLNTSKLNVKFELDIEDFLFETNQCIALGMILSELISNSFKHAFNKIKLPTINIQLRQTIPNMIQLIYGDNGAGIDKNILFNESMGYRLINIFTTQMNGKYNIDSENSYLFVFEFPLVNE